MLGILLKEFTSLFKSIKSLFIIALFSLFSYWVSDIVSVMQLTGSSEYYSGIRLLVFLFGYLFATILSHNVVNREIENKTIRLLISKVSRADVFLGKLAGTLLFWFICLSLSFVIIWITGNVFDLSTLFTVLITMTYYVSIVFLLSTVIERSSLSNFTGLLLGLLIPIGGLWVTLRTTSKAAFLKYVLPYYFLLEGAAYMLVPLAISMLLIVFSVYLLNRKDL